MTQTERRKARVGCDMFDFAMAAICLAQLEKSASGNLKGRRARKRRKETQRQAELYAVLGFALVWMDAEMDEAGVW